MSDTKILKPASTISQLRKVTLLSMIAIYSISALFGIIAVFMPEFEWRIIATTALIGTGCLIVLCGLTVTNIPKWKFLTYFVNILGILAVTLTLLFLWEIVKDPVYLADSSADYAAKVRWYDLTFNILILSWFWAFAGLSSALLVSASHNVGRITQIASNATITLITIVFTLSSSLFLFPSNNSDDYTSMKILVVFIILATLGFLITITVSLIQKATKKSVEVNPLPVVTYYDTATVLEPASSEDSAAAFKRLTDAATESGMPVDAYIDLLLKLHKMASNYEELE